MPLKLCLPSMKIILVLLKVQVMKVIQKIQILMTAVFQEIVSNLLWLCQRILLCLWKKQAHVSSRSSQSYKHYSDHWEDERLESRRYSYEEKCENIANKGCLHAEKFFHKGTEKNLEISFMQPSRKQVDNHLPEITYSQNDGVDSTSHSDVKSDHLGHSSTEEIIKAKTFSRQQEELPVYSDDFEDTPSKSRQQTTFLTDQIADMEKRN